MNFRDGSEHMMAIDSNSPRTALVLGGGGSRGAVGVGLSAKNPSFWIHRVEFVRQYQRIDGFWLPFRDETTVDLRIHDRKIFTIDHANYSINKADHGEAHASEGLGEERQGAGASTLLPAKCAGPE